MWNSQEPANELKESLIEHLDSDEFKLNISHKKVVKSDITYLLLLLVENLMQISIHFLHIEILCIKVSINYSFNRYQVNLTVEIVYIPLKVIQKNIF